MIDIFYHMLYNPFKGIVDTGRIIWVKFVQDIHE